MHYVVVVGSADQATLGQYFFGNCSCQHRFGCNKLVMVSPIRYRLKNLDGVVVKESSKRGFKTLRDAKVFAEDLKREHAETLYKEDNPETTMTFAELYERYKVSRLGDKPSTIHNRECLIQPRVIPFFGEMQIKDIGQDTISQWHACFYDKKGNPIFSETYLRGLHARLSAILNYAVNCGWIPQEPRQEVLYRG